MVAIAQGDGSEAVQTAQLDSASEPTRYSPERSLYELVGGEEGLRQLVETFYDVVEFEPDGRDLHRLHMRGHGVAHSRIEQLNFLSGFLGGPNLYAQKYGHSNVRQMHEHVEISAEAKDAWLKCMSIAIDRVGLAADARARLLTPFTRVATMLVNQESLASDTNTLDV
ncbi:MAG: group II truncated hemoglobin [Hyphomicrobium sp.]|jgi:hemoglobin